MYRLNNLSKYSEDTVLFPWNRGTPYPAIVPTLAVVAALVLGQVTGHSAAGSIAAGSAFTVGFAVFHEALASTILSMAVLTLGIASATLAGSLGAEWTPVVLILAMAAAINYGLLAGIGNTTGWIGQQCAVFVIVSSYFAQGLHYAVGRTGMVLAGGTLQIVLFAASNFIRRRWRTGNTAPLPVVRQVGTRSLQVWRAFRDELHWSSDVTSYVVRLAITLGLSTALYRHFGWHNGYWAPMTALLVLKPKWANTLSRGIARLTGTLVGAGICALMAIHPLLHHWTYFLLIALTAWICFALQAVNYAAFSTFLTMYTVFLFAFGGFSERSAAGLRLANTAIGGGVALLVDFIAQQIGRHFPTRTPDATPAPAISAPR